MQLFLTYDKSLSLVNTYQAIKVLNVNQDSSQEEIKAAYRKLALEVHPDKNQDKKEDGEFKKITEAYTYLKKITIKKIIYPIKKQLKVNQIVLLKENRNGEHQMMEASLNKIGENILVNLKREILLFGKSMRENFGKIITHVFVQTEEMENMKKQKSPKSNQIFLWT